MLEQAVQVLFAAATAGCLYAMVAVGVSLIYSCTGIINFAQGEFVMLGGMTMVSLYATHGWPVAAAMLTTIFVVALYACMLMAVSTRFGRPASLITVLIITIGMSIGTSGVAARVWGTDTYRFPPLGGDAPIQLLGARITPQAIWIILTTVVAVGCVQWFLRKTLTGRAMRACAIDRDAAIMMGVPARRMVLLSFVASGVLGGIGGIVATPLTTVDYSSGMLLAIKGFSAAMLGGMGSVTGAMLGALLIALLESVSISYFSSALKDVTTFVIVIVVLLALPRGLLGGRREIGLRHDDHTSH